LGVKNIQDRRKRKKGPKKKTSKSKNSTKGKWIRKKWKKVSGLVEARVKMNLGEPPYYSLGFAIDVIFSQASGQLWDRGKGSKKKALKLPAINRTCWQGDAFSCRHKVF